MPENRQRINAVLIFIYGIFSLAASARASYQIATKFSEAPISYLLSALSALVYIAATIALARRLTKLATYCLVFELSGVVIVGVLSVLLPDDFQHQTVWSLFGSGYAFIPLILPIWGLLWLRKANRD